MTIPHNLKSPLLIAIVDFIGDPLQKYRFSTTDNSSKK